MTRLLLAAAMVAVTAPAGAQDCEPGDRAFDHLGGTTCIPEAPARIVGLHDQQVTMTLIEMGAPVVGSHGRLGADGPFMRGVRLVQGLGFENSGIAYIGTFDAMDFEAVAALEPDLIIGREWEMETRDTFEAIAPTVFVANDPQDPLAFPRGVADAAGALARWDRMNAAFEATLARARTALPQVDGATYAKIQGWEGELNVYAGYGGLTYVLAELGLERMPLAQEMSDRGVAWGEVVSPEVLSDLDADFLFDTYTIAYGDSLDDPAARMTEVFPAWCDVLRACTAGRYIVLPREYASGFSFAELNATVHLATTHMARNLPE
ncbi:MAG: ABC transporter substrate-binding protein [Pseudomonadota bacterium]